MTRSVSREQLFPLDHIVNHEEVDSTERKWAIKRVAAYLVEVMEYSTQGARLDDLANAEDTIKSAIYNAGLMVLADSQRSVAARNVDLNAVVSDIAPDSNGRYPQDLVMSVVDTHIRVRASSDQTARIEYELDFNPHKGDGQEN